MRHQPCALTFSKLKPVHGFVELQRITPGGKSVPNCYTLRSVMLCMSISGWVSQGTIGYSMQPGSSEGPG